MLRPSMHLPGPAAIERATSIGRETGSMVHSETSGRNSWTALPPNHHDVIIVHTSDLHVDHDYTARLHGGDGTAGLACVLNASRSIGADLVLLAGDTFDSHRVPEDVLDRAAIIISQAGLPVVLLPGNHDPAIPEAIYRR